MPPQPSDRASAAPHRLRARSSRSETIAVYFSRIHSTTCASGIAENIAENAAASQDQLRYSIVERALTMRKQPSFNPLDGGAGSADLRRTWGFNPLNGG